MTWGEEECCCSHTFEGRLSKIVSLPRHTTNTYFLDQGKKCDCSLSFSLHLQTLLFLDLIRRHELVYFERGEPVWDGRQNLQLNMRLQQQIELNKPYAYFCPVSLFIVGALSATTRTYPYPFSTVEYIFFTKPELRILPPILYRGMKL